MFSVPVRKQYPQRVASILFLPPSQPVNELNENGMSEDQGQGSASQSVALEGTTAFHKRIIQEVPDFRLPQVSVDDLPFGSGGSSDVVALDFTETAAWSQELSQP